MTKTELEIVAEETPALPVVDPRATASLALPEAELQLVAAVVHLGLVTEVQEHIKPEHLHRADLGIVLRAAFALADARESVSEATVVAWLRSRHQLDAAKGALVELRAASCDPKAIPTLARAVVEHATARQVADACRQGLALLLSSKSDPASAREMALKVVADAGAKVERRIEVVEMYDVSRARYDEWSAQRDGRMPKVRRTLSTGFARLDAIMGGLRMKAVSYFGAKSGHGKTALADNIVARVCGVDFNGCRAGVVVIAGEMEPEETHDRMVCAYAGVSERMLARVMGGENDLEDEVPLGSLERETIEANIDAALAHLQSIPLAIYPASGDLGAIRYAIRASEKKWRDNASDPANPPRCRLVVVDYIQMMRLPGAERHDLALAGFSNGAKDIARDFDCHVLLTAQLDEEGRLKHSRDMQNAGHTVAELRRPVRDMDPDDDRREQWERYAEIRVRKGRNHAAGEVVVLHFNGPTYRFRDPTPGEFDALRRQRADAASSNFRPMKKRAGAGKPWGPGWDGKGAAE